MKVMTSNIWKSYKKNHGIIPRCVACNKPILVGDKYEPTSKSQCYVKKYLCEEHAKMDVVVYQYPQSNPANKVGEKFGRRFGDVEGEI